MNKTSIFKRLFLVLALALTFVSGFFVGTNHVRSPGVIGKESFMLNRDVGGGERQGVNANLYWEVWNEIQKSFVGAPISDTQLFYGSLSGLVHSLRDRYSSFYTPEESEEFDRDLDGEFEGIGAEIGVKRDRIVIIAPLPDSPAQEAGLLPGDWIVLINDEPTQTLSLDEAVKKIRGPKGTTVTLEIVRNLESETPTPLTISIVRDRIIIREVEQTYLETPDGKQVAHVKLFSFNKNAFSEMREAALDIQKRNVGGLIFDLRNNGGGLLDQAADVAGLWLPHDAVVVWEEYSGGQKDRLLSGGSQLFSRHKTVVLINKGSASASEIVAGALQDHGVATIIGEISFGKGSVQTYEKLSDGSALKLTVAKWLTPNQRMIDGEGITPDIAVELTEEDFANDRDPQLEKALEMLDEEQKL